MYFKDGDQGEENRSGYSAGARATRWVSKAASFVRVVAGSAYLGRARNFCASLLACFLSADMTAAQAESSKSFANFSSRSLSAGRDGSRVEITSGRAWNDRSSALACDESSA